MKVFINSFIKLNAIIPSEFDNLEVSDRFSWKGFHYSFTFSLQVFFNLSSNKFYIQLLAQRFENQSKHHDHLF